MHFVNPAKGFSWHRLLRRTLVRSGCMASLLTVRTSFLFRCISEEKSVTIKMRLLSRTFFEITAAVVLQK